jgi:hypothetical protein
VSSFIPCLATPHWLFTHFPPRAQASCRLALALAREAQERGSQGGVEQALHLLQLAARLAADGEAPGAAMRAGKTDAEQGERGAGASVPAGVAAACGEPARKAAAEAGVVSAAESEESHAETVASDLGPAVSLLAVTMLQAAPGMAAGRLSRQAWHALFDALRPARLRLGCLRALLGREHPEVCALLLQRARQDAAAGAISEGEAWSLCEPWLRPGGQRGWRAPDSAAEGQLGGSGGGSYDWELADRANALCAALNVLLLLRLRQQQRQRAAAASSDGGSCGDSGGGSDARDVAGEGLPAPNHLRRFLLVPLSDAVKAELARLKEEAEREGERGGPGAGAAAAGEAAAGKGGGDGAGALGEGQGTGSAVDAWLALSRVEDAAARLLELCG